MGGVSCRFSVEERGSQAVRGGASRTAGDERRRCHNPQPRIFPVGRSSKMYGETCVFFEHRGSFASIVVIES